MSRSVRVVCESSKHPKLRSAVVGEFFEDCNACFSLNCERSGGSRPHQPDWQLAVGKPGRASQTAQRVDIRRGDLRQWRYRLQCPLCKLNVTANAEVLNPELARAADGGSSIDLADLAARVASK